MTKDTRDAPCHVDVCDLYKPQELMEGLFTDCQVVVTGSKAYSDFHTPGWMSMTVDVTSACRIDKK